MQRCAAAVVGVLACSVALLVTGTARAEETEGPPERRPPPALQALFRACPKLEGLVSASFPRDEVSWSSVKLTRSQGGAELRRGDGVAEHYWRVELPRCGVLGYSWSFEYAGGYHLTPTVQPTLSRDGTSVSWSELSRDEQAALVQAMGATPGTMEDLTLAGLLVRAKRASTSQAPPANADAQVLVPQRMLEGHWRGAPKEEGRVFIPCVEAAECGELATGWLFLGSRTAKRQRMGDLDVYRVIFPATTASSTRVTRSTPPGQEGFVMAGRVFGPGERLVFHDRRADRHTYALVDECCSWFIRSITATAGGALRISAGILRFPDAFQREFLFDFASGALFWLPGYTVADGGDVVMTDEDSARRIVWYTDMHGVVIDFAQLISSAGRAGVETVSAANTLAWGESHGNISTVMAVFLLTQEAEVARATLETLARFPGWEAAADPVVGLRAAPSKWGLVASQIEVAVDEIWAEPWRQLVLLGTRGDEAFLLWPHEGAKADELIPGRKAGSFDAVITVPRNRVLPADQVERLKQLERAMWDHTVCLRGEDDDCLPFADAVSRTLSRRPPSPGERRRFCAAEKELLRGYERWELLEVLDARCQRDWFDVSADGDSTSSGVSSHRTPESMCNAWKALCKP